jgi:GNAT superfamily N-acetyltransferase
MGHGRDSVEAAEQNYFSAWKLLVGRAEGCLVEETDDVLFTSVPDSTAYFNSAFVKPPADPSTCIAAAAAFFAARQTPFTLRFRASPESDALSQAAGFSPASLSPLMNAAVGDISPPHTRIEIKRVKAETWDDHVRALALGFGMPVALAARLFGPSLSRSEEYAAFNVYVDGEVASTAALIVSDTVAGVYNVATPEAFRRRGLGEATTRAAVAEGQRRGCLTATLQSSEMGYPIYERMGFQTSVTWRSLVSP